jgi:predicted aspartyl protease
MNEAAIEERGMDGKYLVVTCALSLNNCKVPTHALIDCGATGYAFIDKDFADLHQLPLYPLKIPRALEVIDGWKISSGDITHLAEAQLHIQEHCE